MEFDGTLSGCMLSLGIGIDGATVCCVGGMIHWKNGAVQGIPPCSAFIQLGDTPRRVRAYMVGAHAPSAITSAAVNPPVFAYVGKPNLFMQVDDDQATGRGVYPGGLIVLGHIDVPAKPALTSGMDTNPAKAPVLPGQNGRRLDAIGREIAKAIARIQERDTCAIINQHTVMDELANSVGQGCIKKATTNRQAIVWVTASGKEKDFDKEALRKRLG